MYIHVDIAKNYTSYRQCTCIHVAYTQTCAQLYRNVST